MSIVSFGRDRELRKQRKALKARFCEWREVNVTRRKEAVPWIGNQLSFTLMSILHF